MSKCCEFFLPDFVSAKAKSLQESGIDQLKRNVGRLFVDDCEVAEFAVVNKQSTNISFQLINSRLL